MSADPNRLIAGLAREQVYLDLKTVDLCFLAGLYLRADRAALVSFEEEVLVDLFEQVCEVVDLTAENPRKRATHALARLREQRMLARVDGAGIVRAGEYVLTGLAAALVQHLLADEALTRESLTLLTGTLRVQLAEVLAAAQKAEGEEAWLREVAAPLRVTVGDLVMGIERRQRGLDVQQEEVQAEIAALLQADWFGAVERCQALLEKTTETLRELNEVLLRDTHHFVALLQDIQTLAEAAGHSGAEGQVQRVIEQVDRIGAWGNARQRAWSNYYQYVHRYLRDVVRLDPDRALSQRLRDQVASWPSRPFFLGVAGAPSIRLLRPLEARILRPAVTRPRSNREADPEPVAAEDAMAQLERLVQEALAEGLGELSQVTARVLAQWPQESADLIHYLTTGRVAEIVARLRRVAPELERPWKKVTHRIEIEDWNLVVFDPPREVE